MLERISEVRPFALTLPMVAAAAPSVQAQAAIERFLFEGRKSMRAVVRRFIDWLHGPAGIAAPPSEAQKRFAMVRLRFLSVITQFDLFADALAERSQHGYGELLGGLDVLATDALRLPGALYATPPVICHLDRGIGAAIRRARTRLPGGGSVPVAIIRVPRERMVGSSIASSLVHEVGHQGAALLDLVPQLAQALQHIAAHAGRDARWWRCLAGWISEIIADYWSVARLGITSTLGLIGVVGLPKAFVSRFASDDVHPVPWIRVKISIAIGRSLYPDVQWDRLESLWESLYPLEQTGRADAAAFRALDRLLPRFVAFLNGFSAPRLDGRTIAGLFPRADRTPARLRTTWARCRGDENALAQLSPTLACAVIGQAKYDNAIDTVAEVTLLRRLLRFWALESTTNAREVCSSLREPTGLAIAV